MTATKSNVNVKIDSSIKEQAIQLLNRMGLDQTTAIDMFYRQIIVERRLPFQPTVAHTYGEQLRDIIKRKGIPNVTLPADANGHAYIDKEEHPELYDWAVNG
jgi:DNA-damage-inducible protein J